jgi:Protein of unknown function (DUF2637)
VTGVLRVPRFAALVVITVLVTAASLVSFAESYRGLYLWASHHGLSGVWAAGFPLQCDVFIAVGELALFVALADRWSPRSRMSAWMVTLAGLAVSVAGNVGHIGGHTFADRATAAVPPLAAASALAVGLGVLKRVVAARHQGTESPAAFAEFAPAGQCSHGVAATAQEAVVAAFLHGRDCLGLQPSQRQLSAQFGVSRAKVAELVASLNGQPDSAPGTDLAALR